ncbi:MAG: hypothetical protein GY855_06550 [candidate division Zixibacteria bacterium]|nr:hypothetical protein [candidate division Zixibacteria bacterium]
MRLYNSLLLSLIIILSIFTGCAHTVRGGFPIQDRFGLIMYGKLSNDTDYWNDLDSNLQIDVVWAQASVFNRSTYELWKDIFTTAKNRGMMMCGPGANDLYGWPTQSRTIYYCKAYDTVVCWKPSTQKYYGINHFWGYHDSLNGEPVWAAKANSTDPNSANNFIFGPRYNLFKNNKYDLIYNIAVGECTNGGELLCSLLVTYTHDGRYIHDRFYIDDTMFQKNDSLHSFDFKIDLGINNEMMNDREPFEFKLYSTKIQDIYVSSFLICEDRGKELFESDRATTEITEHIRHFSDSAFFGPLIQDEPDYYQFPAYGKIRQIVSDSLASKNLPEQYFKSAQNLFVKEFVDVAKPKWLNLDYYPFRSECGDSCLYYGDFQEGGQHGRRATGLQRHLTEMHKHLLGSTRYALDSAETKPEKVYFTLMGFHGENSHKRGPTYSELRCSAGLGLSAGIHGFSVFRYSSVIDGNNDSLYGLYNFDGTPDTLYYALKDAVVPLVRGIESIYLDLGWVNTYTYSPADTIPINSYINDISYLSEPPNIDNPDIGWYQLAEFVDKRGIKHLLIVNRACNDTLGNTAPAVRTRIYLNSRKFPASKYIVTNVDSRMNESYDTAQLPKGQNFVTILEAGETKLFRIERKYD